MRIILIFILSFNLIYSQEENRLIRKGNEKFDQEQFNSAIEDYSKSLNINPENKYAKFNMGNAYYKLDSTEAAENYYQGLFNSEVSEIEKSAAYYNYGNSLLKEQKFDKSIEAYKNALKLNPKDQEAKYNLEYAKHMLQQQQNQEQQQNQDKNKEQNEKDQKQNQDQKNQDQNNKNDKQKEDQKNQKKQNQKKEHQAKNDKQKGQQNQPQDQKKNEKGQGAKPQEMKISKEQAEQILKNLAKQEKAILMKNKKKKGEKKKVEKNW